ncbi:hypothetical protein [Maricaulis sp.]|uniref:DUF7668 domain-containing protein n=1 Tax=Maricaulis sp. TaxID=1486257 RepID=UPI003A901F97
MKDLEKEQAVPTEWRPVLCEIVDAIRNNTYDFSSAKYGVDALPEARANQITNNIEDYGCELDRITDEVWSSSVCRWQDGYWDLLVDLRTKEEGLSDLALIVRVFDEARYRFEVMSVHVP